MFHSSAPKALASPELAGAKSEGDALAVICESPLQVVINRRRVLNMHGTVDTSVKVWCLTT